MRAESLEPGSGIWVHKTAFAIHIQDLERTVVFDPHRFVQVDECVLTFIWGLISKMPSRASVNNVENE